MGNCGSKKAEKTVVEPEEPKPSAVPEEPVEEEPVATEKPSPEAEAEPAPTEEEAEAPNAFSAREDPDPVVPKGLPDVNVWHPQSEMEVQGIVRQARAEGKKVRVVGSGHSVWDAVVPAGFAQTGEGDWLIVFDNMRELAMDGTRVRAQAGSNLGVSPRLPHFEPITTDAALAPSAQNLTRPFSWEESLCYFLDQQGRALPDLGGISHQTVAGFLSTG
ncbi:hypothetical protein EMIHUDRAFT_212761 [Emiliania huxleyi CCMP1516]|uniref:FAD-binding PCMH-type domain-containing protein n=2 Tax=Emiliania huxleyi TaxID=2903 RepID=A0A0D3IQS4_EMIH1|nr:hypothetical protein EMIHUDRAFT_212761 [Emiliania huxleyi CCMP1516]EOD13609.1 hypothetical protein EMIHUDRAFT_212761 [Emiliania huxleyi CCMP1516]|eukprot:XP_005766038.1 hypothetical protein EMIHUDRAFT_212761 [Emiliania huxleyi CCMP1516]